MVWHHRQYPLQPLRKPARLEGRIENTILPTLSCPLVEQLEQGSQAPPPTENQALDQSRLQGSASPQARSATSFHDVQTLGFHITQNESKHSVNTKGIRSVGNISGISGKLCAQTTLHGDTSDQNVDEQYASRHGTNLSSPVHGFHP